MKTLQNMVRRLQRRVSFFRITPGFQDRRRPDRTPGKWERSLGGAELIREIFLRIFAYQKMCEEKYILPGYSLKYMKQVINLRIFRCL